MTDREKIIIITPPIISNDPFFKWFTLDMSSTERGAREFSNRFIIPRRRMTMPEIMNGPKPCYSCAKTGMGCPDQKEAIVMCVGDYLPLNPWKYATDRIIEIKNSAVKMGKSLETAAESCKEAAKNFKKAFANTHLGEWNSEWNTEPEDPIGDFERAIGRRIPGPFKKIKGIDNDEK